MGHRRRGLFEYCQRCVLVGGGEQNAATGAFATIGGGGLNTASGSYYATVGGGTDNTASGNSATVPGGDDNVAQGDYSLAAGRRAKAYYKGCFVWGDSTDSDVTCDYDDRWVARASGGVYFYTSANYSTGAYLAAGSGTGSSVSDRALKQNVAAVDAEALLARLAQVPVTTWSCVSQDPGIRHIGPMAQDFYAAFGVDEDETHIATVDADGVALAAIQALYAAKQSLDLQVNDLEARVAALEETHAPVRSGAVLPWLLAGGLVVATGTWAARRRPGGGR